MSNILRERINTARTLKGAARTQELKYLGYQMKELGQEKLIRMIDELEYQDLKLLFAAGVPGSAYLHTLSRYQGLKNQIEDYAHRVR